MVVQTVKTVLKGVLQVLVQLLVLVVDGEQIYLVVQAQVVLEEEWVTLQEVLDQVINHL